MNSEIPDRQLTEWGFKRLRMQASALRGLDNLLRMSRHDGRAYIRPVTPHRSVLVWSPFNQFLQQTIVQCGRTRITNSNVEIGVHVELPISDRDRLLIVGRPEFIVDAVGRQCIVVTDADVRYHIDVLELPVS